MSDSFFHSAVNLHDAYASSVFRRIDKARGFFRGYLPERLERPFDWRTLRLESSSFVNDELGRQYADLVFSVRFKGETTPRRIRLLFEHKSEVRYHVSRQMHRYISRIFEETPDAEPLPPVICVLLVQSGVWRRSAEFAEQYELPEETLALLEPYLLNFQMVIVSLEELRQSELQGTVEGRLALSVMKAIGEKRPLEWTKQSELLDEVSRQNPQRLTGMFRRLRPYVAGAISAEQRGEFQEAVKTVVQNHQSLEKEMVSLKEHWLLEGEEKGIGKGIGKGMALMLSDLLPLLYDEYSPEESRIEELSRGRLEELKKAVQSRKSWEEIKKLLPNGQKS